MGMNKRSQTEIMGLVVIVLLLSIAILFVVMFFMRAEKESPQEAFTQEQTPYNMINAILETDSGCRATKMRDLFKEWLNHAKILQESKTEPDELGDDNIQIPQQQGLGINESDAISNREGNLEQ